MTTEVTTNQSTNPQTPSEITTPPPAPQTPPAEPQTPPSPASSEVTPPPAPQTPPAEEFEEYELELPSDSGLSDKDLEEVATFAEKYGLSKDEAQDVLNKRAQVYTSAKTGFQNDQIAAAKAEQDKLLAHEHFNTEEKRNEFIGYINRAVNALGGEDLVKVLKGPIGNNMPIVLAFREIGKLMGDDNFVKSTGTPTPRQDTQVSALQKMYPSFFEN